MQHCEFWNYSLENLLDCARKGDREAKELLFTQALPGLLKFASNFLPPDLQSKTTPSDLVQESLMTAFCSFEKFTGHCQAEWISWLRGIVRNKAAHLWRTYRATLKRDSIREVRLSILLKTKISSVKVQEQISTAEDLAMLGESCEIVLHAMSQLPTIYQRVLELRFWDCLPFRFIATELECSEEAARSLCIRAMRKLAKRSDIQSTYA